MMTSSSPKGSSWKKVISRILAGICSLCGIILLFSFTWGGVLLLVFASVISPYGNGIMEKLFPIFWTGRKKQVSKIGILVVAIIVIMSSNSSNIPGKYLGTIYPDQGTHNTQQVKDFATTLAQLVLAYQSADLTEKMSLEFSPLDFTEDGYVEMMGLVSAKRKEVIEWNNKLAEFAKYAEDKISFLDIPQSTYSPFAVYAIGAEDSVDRALKADNTAKYAEEQKQAASDAAKEKQRKILEQIDLIKAAYPNKKRFEIINARMGLAGKQGIARMEERSLEDVKTAAEVVAYNNKREARYNAGQTAIKIVLYTAALPEAIAAGGAVTAASVFIGGVDIGVGVGDTIDIVVNGDNENTLWKDIKNGTSPATQAYGNIMLIKDVTSLIKNPSKWTTDELMTLLNLAAGEVDPENALILNVSENGQIEAYYADEIPEGMGFAKGQTLNDFDTPPIRGEFESIERYMTRVESWKAMKEYLERPSTKMEIARLKKAREEYRAEKEKQYQLINEKAAAARRVTNARKQVQAEAAKDPELKAALDKLNIDTTPAQTPTPAPSTPSVSPGTITTCSVCAQGGLDCACGRAACRCCSPGDNNCNAYDL